MHKINVLQKLFNVDAVLMKIIMIGAFKKCEIPREIDNNGVMNKTTDKKSDAIIKPNV